MKTFSLRLWKPGESRPWRWYRSRERRDEMAAAFREAGWNVETRDPSPSSAADGLEETL